MAVLSCLPNIRSVGLMGDILTHNGIKNRNINRRNDIRCAGKGK